MHRAPSPPTPRLTTGRLPGAAPANNYSTSSALSSSPAACMQRAAVPVKLHAQHAESAQKDADLVSCTASWSLLARAALEVRDRPPDRGILTRTSAIDLPEGGRISSLLQTLAHSSAPCETEHAWVVAEVFLREPANYLCCTSPACIPSRWSCSALGFSIKLRQHRLQRHECLLPCSPHLQHETALLTAYLRSVSAAPKRHLESRTFPTF